MSNPPRKGSLESIPVIFLILISALAVSFSSILIRWSSSSAVQIVFYRLVFTSLLVFPFVTWKREAFPSALKERVFLVISGIALAFHFIFWVSSLWFTSVSESVLLVVSTHPVIVALVSSMFFNERPGSSAVLGMGMAILGNTLLVITALGKGDLIGDILAILGGLMFAIYLLVGRVLRQGITLGNYAFPVYGVAVIIVAIVAVTMQTGLLVSEPREIFLFFLMALIPGLFGHTLYNYLLKNVRAYVISVTLLAEPVGATILAILLLREIPRDIVIAGSSMNLLWVYPIIIAGVYLVISEKQKTTKTEK